MLSILIPTYNYNIENLIVSLDEALKIVNLDYEILCQEDGSTSYLKENKAICNSIDGAFHFVSKKNKGRITTRQLLAEKASYNWLLFLDADVIPKNKNFIKKYFDYIHQQPFEAIYGGCSYDSERPETEHILRWKYGIAYEYIEASKRNKNPYKHIVSANYMINKKTFLSISSQIKNDGYGYDIFFGALMKSNATKVFHINNFVIHKGLDHNAEFLEKVKKAIKTLLELYRHNQIENTDSSLLELFKKLNSLGMTKVVAFMFYLFKKPLTKQLLGNNPKMTLLQFYKLGYLSSLNLKK